MQAWEYCQDVVRMGRELATCNERGAEGWELVNMGMVQGFPTSRKEDHGKVAHVIVPQGQPEMVFMLLFKRPKQKPKPPVDVMVTGNRVVSTDKSE